MVRGAARFTCLASHGGRQLSQELGNPKTLVPICQLRYHMCRAVRKWMVSRCVEGQGSPDPFSPRISGKKALKGSRQLVTPARWSLIALDIQCLIVPMPFAITLVQVTV